MGQPLEHEEFIDSSLHLLNVSVAGRTIGSLGTATVDELRMAAQRDAVKNIGNASAESIRITLGADFADASHFPPLEFRFKYYLGKQDGCPKPKDIGFRSAGDHLFLYPCGIELPFPCEECTSGMKDLAGGNYARDLAQLCEHTPLKLALPVTLGDNLTRWQSVVGKARSVGGCGALMPLNTPRRWPTVPSLSDSTMTETAKWQ